MDVLDEDEKPHFKKKLSTEEYLLELVRAKDNARFVCNSFEADFQNVLDRKWKSIREKQPETLALGKRIAELKRLIEEKQRNNIQSWI